MNFLLGFLFIFNALQNDGDCLPEWLKKHVKSVDNAPYLRIFRGTPAEEKQFPYQVSVKIRLKNEYVNFCGGAIIAPSRVLSAAHCFYNDKKGSCYGKPEELPLINVFAVAGTLINTQYDKEGVNDQWRTIIRTVAPNDYVFPRRDIAIVFTSKPFTYNDHVNQIPYAREHNTYTDKGVICVATGYGQTETGHQSEKLLWAKLEILSTSTCNELHQKNMKRFVCTSGAMTDVGVGDSGGPLVCKNTGHTNEVTKGILVGVVSGKRIFRQGSDGKSSNNAFFTRVSSYKQLIQKNRAHAIVPDITLWDKRFKFLSISIFLTLLTGICPTV